MAAIFQIRRGTTAQKPTLAAGEMYVDQSSENLVIGVDGSKEITLLKLNDLNTGSLHLTGDIKLSGSIYLGDATADNISALGVFTTNLVPSPTNTINIGTTTAYWKNVYATSISGAIAATNGVISGSSQLDTAFERIASSTHTLVSGSSQIIGILDSLNSFSGSQLTQNIALATISGSLISTASANTISISNLNTFSSSQLTKDSTLATYTASIETRLTQIGVVSGSLITTASNHEQRIGSIESYTSSLRTAIGVSGTNVTINGDLSVLGTTTQINSTQVNIGDNIIELNYGGAATTAGILTKDATGGSTTSGSLLWDSTNDYWKGGTSGNESKLLLAGGDNVLTSSLQLTELNNTTSSLNSFTSSANNRLNNLESKSASVDVSISNLNTFTSSQLTQNSTLASYTSSLEARMNAIATETASLETRATTLAQVTSSILDWTASAKVELSNLESKSASVDVNIVNIHLFTSSVDTKFSTLATYTGSVDTKFTTLEQVTSSLMAATASLFWTASDHEQRLDDLRYDVDLLTPAGLSAAFDAINNATASLQTFSSSALIRLNNLELTSQSVNTSITNINSLTASLTNTYEEKASATHTLVSGSSQIIGILDSLNSFTSSLNATYATDAEVAAGYEAKGRGIFSGSSQIIGILDSLNSFTASLDATYATDAEIAAAYESKGRGIVSGSSQITPLLPVGTVSGSSQVISILGSLNSFTASLDATYATEAEVAAGYEAKGRGIWSGSAQLPVGVISGSSQVDGTAITNKSITIAGTSTSLGGSITAAKILEGTNVISSSTQITSLLPVGVVSGSSQIDATLTTNWATGIKTQLNTNTVVSGSSQINLGSAAGNITLATQTTGDYVASLVQGTGVTITNNSGENATPTIAIGQAVGTSANVQFASIGVGTAASGVSGEIRATGDITAYYSSDERLKFGIVPIENALSKIESISGNRYHWKEGFENIHSHKGADLGVIAQEVQSVLPEVVTERETGYLAVDYIKLVPVLIEAIKELSAKIDRLENK